MYELLYSLKKNLILILAVTGCLTMVVLSAWTASSMYKPTRDAFTSTLNENIARLCQDNSPDLSETHLSIIRQARIKSIRYSTDEAGNKLFYARIFLPVPEAGSLNYSGRPEEVFGDVIGRLSDSAEGEECDIYGICRDNTPIVDMDTITAVIDAAEKAWQKETLSENAGFQKAVTDALIPEPFDRRVFSESGAYTAEYSDWLNRASAQFAAGGMLVNVDGTSSGQPSDIRSAMEKIITPYLCSLRTLSLARSETKPGLLLLSFDSLDVIGTLSTANKPSLSAINKLSGVYSDERAMKVSIELDIAKLKKDGEFWELPFFNLIRAMTRYGSSIGTSPVKIKIPDSSKVIAGQSDGVWPVQLKRAKGDGNIIVNVIRVDDAGNEQSVVKVFLTDGGNCTVCLSKGKYRLNFAVGTTYYGSVELFGVNGRYLRDTQNIYSVPSVGLTSITIPKQPGETISFSDYLLWQGSDPSLIDKTQF